MSPAPDPLVDRCLAALRLWRDCEQRRRTLTSRLYRERDNPARVQELIDAQAADVEAAFALTERLLAEAAGQGSA